MAVIGIITCEILELEFARFLGEDPELGRISVLEDAHSGRLIDLLERRPVRALHRLPHVHAFAREPGEPLEVLIRVLEIGLHRNRSVLRHALSSAARELRSCLDVLLLGYGLCGNALEDPRAVLDVDVPVFLPMNDGHPIDDCVALCLGGREQYQAQQRKAPGTFFLTPGWACHWRRMIDGVSGAIAQPALQRVLAGYERALVVTTPAMGEDQMLPRAEDFSRETGLRLERCAGTMAPLEVAWAAAKRSARDVHAGARGSGLSCQG